MKRRCLTWILAILMIVSLCPIQKADAATTKTHSVTTNQIKTIVNLTGYMDTDKSISTNVTRAQFAQILYNLTSASGQAPSAVSVKTYSDVSNTYWAAGYIKTAVDNGYMSGYLNGKFKPKQAITLQEAVYGILRVLGYSDTDFTSGLSANVMSLYKKLDLNTNITLSATKKLTKTACINLIYNLLVTENTSGEVFGATKGYTINSNGDVDYLTLVGEYTEGPVIASVGWSSTYTSSDYTTVYLNDKLSSYSKLCVYDVLYYNDILKTIWAYNTKVTGILESVSPSRTAPTSISIAGVSYDLGTQDMINQFSNIGSVNLGDIITVFLGSEGEVVGMVGVDSYNTILKGFINKVYTETVTDDTSTYTGIFLDVIDFEGTTYKVEYTGSLFDFTYGDVVSVDYSGTTAKVTKLSSSFSAYGTVSDDGTTLGDTPFASDVKIIDISEYGYSTVTTTRLEGVYLDSNNVLYGTTNTDGEIDSLVLDDITHDCDTYGIITDITSSSSTETFTYLVDGATNTGSVSGVSLSEFPSRIMLSGTTVEDVESLKLVYVQSLQKMTITATNSTVHKIADDVSVYYYDSDDGYTLTKLSKVSDLDQYALYAYYDDVLSNGGQVRIIIAKSLK